ncbi:MAG TPA: type II toxin-antitoxin system VapC family toxin [Devosia sp.]
MIGVDTNVLVRHFVGDDQVQAAIATRYLSERTESDPAFVSAAVICELVWVLKRFYGYADAKVHEALHSLFESSNIVIERMELLHLAIGAAHEANADISDAIIAALAADAGATKTVTFDKVAAKRIPAMELLA